MGADVIDIEALRRAQRVLNAQPMPAPETFTLAQWADMIELNGPLIEAIERVHAIESWRMRFNDSRNNPF